ncbi:Sec-independent protein translocase subunit TatB [Pantoea vagans]|uniref:Sec-independent protein translocase protein TatB n=1 Tax=Pantoea sp. XY16 TaxID=2976705 RepID=UPI0013768106|nr:Sec-independent protein translocase protein TatB [Pantoea sp. XY16]MCT2420404.1 Sec-independent protein translocase protein TatB [Pantoea sp. XY16]NBB55129.1 Sec-independent protein translocase subunit TatB [Pantoea vagans]
MFDIGFSELVLVFVIGLIVLGPQRLPVAVKTVVGWIRAIRSLAANVQHELAQELKLQELQESLKKVEEAGRGTLSPELKESMEELRKTADSMKRSVSQSIDIEKEEDEANTIHSAQHRPAPHAASAAVPASEPAVAESSVTPASAAHQASAAAQSPSSASGPAVQPSAAPAAVATSPAQVSSAVSSAPAVQSSAAPATAASAPAQAPAGDAARPTDAARHSVPSSSASDER